MKIHLYARCWNERDMLPFFFLHYDNLVQRYIIYDDASTDNSQEILRLNPKVELRPMPPYCDPESRISSALALQETCWKESRGIADWVIVTDIDEHLYHPDMKLSRAMSCARRNDHSCSRLPNAVGTIPRAQNVALSVAHQRCLLPTLQ